MGEGWALVGLMWERDGGVALARVVREREGVWRCLASV
jgi:hypothetical protein